MEYLAPEATTLSLRADGYEHHLQFACYKPTAGDAEQLRCS